mmetsp:Transcript_10436/g.63780  ORF Transcript_10436/g.63780 Transcript_10436/m.63780 type:complete len:332 (-) Transcript_10436:180-1175(-)
MLTMNGGGILLYGADPCLLLDLLLRAEWATGIRAPAGPPWASLDDGGDRLSCDLSCDGRRKLVAWLRRPARPFDLPARRREGDASCLHGSFHVGTVIFVDVSIPFADGGEMFFHLVVGKHSELVVCRGDDRHFDLVCFEVFGEHGLYGGDGHPHALVVVVLRVVLDFFLQEVGGFLFFRTCTRCFVSDVESCWIHFVQLRSPSLVHADQHGGDGEGSHAGLLGGHLRFVGHEFGQVIHGDLASVLPFVICGLLPCVLHHGFGVGSLSDRHHAHFGRERKEMRDAGGIQELVRHFLLGDHAHAVRTTHTYGGVSGRFHRFERIFHLIQPSFR